MKKYYQFHQLCLEKMNQSRIIGGIFWGSASAQKKKWGKKDFFFFLSKIYLGRNALVKTLNNLDVYTYTLYLMLDAKARPHVDGIGYNIFVV